MDDEGGVNATPWEIVKCWKVRLDRLYTVVLDCLRRDAKLPPLVHDFSLQKAIPKGASMELKDC